MKNKIKKFLKKIIGPKIFFYIRYAIILYNKIDRKQKNKLNFIKLLTKIKVYYNENRGLELKNLLKNVEIGKVLEKDKFYYYIDKYKTTYYSKVIIENISLDYSIILNNSLDDIQKSLNSNNKEFYDTETYAIEGMKNFIDRIVYELKKIKREDIAKNISNIKNKSAETLQESLQRILFINMLLWQTGHCLNGLGRLDIMLIKYYKKDIENGILNKKQARELIKEFLITLHKFYNIKSNILLGDTGQIIELGGNDINGEYVCNELTYLFIELMEELKLPDPKILVRVSKKTPRKIIENSLKCIQTGIGCPLFANDDVIIEKLINFGYDEKDAFNYGTSACWEPYIIGKSSAVNNVSLISFMVPFNEMLEKEDLKKIENIEELIQKYKKYLKDYLEIVAKKVEGKELDKEPIISLFVSDCIKNSKDISQKGAKYNDIGLTSVGLANVINSICNIDEKVFRDKKITFEQLNNIRKDNFKNNDDLIKKLKNSKYKYGKDDQTVLKLTNDIIKYTTEVLKDKRSCLGGKIKFGLSSPNYIDASKNFPASFDGRKNGEPFAVHISSDNSNAYTELIQFASQIDYNENRFNGNVVDFFVSPNFIGDNFNKFVDFLMLSIKIGFFEMQMNVVSSEQLIEARKHPDKFPNLVVRVWGFSAYFKDLPDEYKDYLIERALKSEGNS